jgi:hypothetical protein
MRLKHVCATQRIQQQAGTNLCVELIARLINDLANDLAEELASLVSP